MSADLELRLLAALPSVEAFEGLEEQGIVAELFVNHRPMYNYIRDIIQETRHLPRLRDLQATFNLPSWVERKTEEFEWLCGEFKRLTTALRVQELFQSAVDAHGDDPDRLVNQLISDLSGIAAASGKQVSITDQSAVARFERYASKMPDSGMMVGIPTGLSYFDSDIQLGWLPGELIGLIGRTYLGKSWILLWFGVRAWTHGKRVLFLSPELTIEEAEARIDGLICGLNGVKVSVTELYRGFMPTEAQKLLAKEMSKKSAWATVTSTTGAAFQLPDFPRVIREYKPDLVLIDGLPHMGMGRQTNRNQQTWEQMRELSYGLKNIAVSMEVPIIVAHQANRAAHNTARPPGLHEIAFGDAFAQACDRVLTLSQMASRPAELKLTIQKFRKGKPVQGGISLDFDPDQGAIRERTDQGRTGPNGDNGPSGETGDGDAPPVHIP